MHQQLSSKCILDENLIILFMYEGYRSPLASAGKLIVNDMKVVLYTKVVLDTTAKAID